MSLLAPFDGSALSAAALSRAAEFGDLIGEPVVALAVVPDDPAYARERGWLDADEPFDRGEIEAALARRAEAVAPGATFRAEAPAPGDERASLTMDVARTIRQVAAEVDASIVFVGSENAGRVAAPVTSVGNPVSEDPRYDVHIVRHPREGE